MTPDGAQVDPTDSKRTAGTLGSFTVMGIPVRFHFTFVLLLAFLVVLGVGGDQSGLTTALYILAIFASVLLHEFGHALVSRRFGIKTEEVVMYPIGGVARLERNPRPREELWITLAGPSVNLLIAGAIFGYLAWRGQIVPVEQLLKPTDANLLERIGAGNLILAAFNLLPAFPMDGGRILRSLLARFRPEDEATRIAAATGKGFAFLMGLYGLLSAQFMLVFIALFVYLGAAQESAAVEGKVLTEGFTVRAAMITDFQTLAHGQTLADAVNLLLTTSQKDFPVLTGKQVIGLLDRNRLMRAVATSPPETFIAGVMEREFTRVDPGADLGEALPKLMEAGGCTLVMEADHLVGMLTSENLSEFLLVRRFGIKPRVETLPERA